MLKRQYASMESVCANYYPVASSIVANGESSRLSIFTGQPHGGTSPVPGTLELMIDRVISHDDGKGLGMDYIENSIPSEQHLTIVLEDGVESKVMKRVD